MATNRNSNKLHSNISEAHDNDIIVDSREIFLHGYIEDSEDSGIDGKQSNRFLKNLHILESIDHTPIVIHQHSTGGEWESGMMIYDAIQQSASSFIFVCHGIAASMGSVIPQAVHNKGVRITMPNCCWLIHEGEQEIVGTSRQVQSYYELSRLTKAKMYSIYSNVCFQTGEYFKDISKAKTKSFIRRKLESKEDWWLTAEDAVKYGFIDGIMGSDKFPSINDIKKNLV